ncbi:MAG TPA: YecA family protein, partial [Ideonella sp.]|nr:YecA family protein [Ideonella sp.]
MPALTDPLTDDELHTLEQLLDQLTAPPPRARGKTAAPAETLEPLDLMMLDGYLCGVLLQPRPVPLAQWFRHVPDVDGRAAPAGYPLAELQALVERRHAELDRAIAQRQWFDPWVFELEDDAEPLETVMPWVAGFATAMELFPALMRIDSTESLEPLAVLYAAFDPEDLEDADALLEAIASLEPPAELADAVEGLVNSTLLLADVSRPQPVARRPAANP